MNQLQSDYWFRGITSIQQRYLCGSLLPVAQSGLECGRYVPPALYLVLVELFLASNLRMLRLYSCTDEEKWLKTPKIGIF